MGLTEDQQTALDCCMSGKNVFITGGGGVGKTYLIHKVVDCLKEVDAQLPDYQIQVAYNLDGGRSTTMVFCGEKINSTSASSSRDIADILYFASAWQGE